MKWLLGSNHSQFYQIYVTNYFLAPTLSKANLIFCRRKKLSRKASILRIWCSPSKLVASLTKSLSQYRYFGGSEFWRHPRAWELQGSEISRHWAVWAFQGSEGEVFVTPPGLLFWLEYRIPCHFKATPKNRWICRYADTQSLRICIST